MIAKVLAQIVFAGAMVQLFPADLSILQSQVNTLDNYSFSQLVASLPVSQIRDNHPIKVDTDSYGVVTTAPSAIVVDAQSGMVLLAKNPDQVRSIGSVTKLMSAIVFLETNPDLDQLVSLDADLDLVTGGRIYLAFNDPLDLREVFAAAIVGSDNTATKALARFAGLTTEEFVERMNAKAQELGMRDTVFTDPTGVDTNNMSTARDLVKLLAAASELPLIDQYSTTSELTVTHESGRAVSINNTNGLLKSFLNSEPYQILAGKTGFLPQAGYLLTTAVQKDGHKIYVLVLGSDSIGDRELEVKSLANWAFQTFKWPET